MPEVDCAHCRRWDHLTCPRGIDCHKGECALPPDVPLTDAEYDFDKDEWR